MALSSKLKEETLIVLDHLELDRIKTSDFVDIINTLNVKSVLIVTDKENANLDL